MGGGMHAIVIAWIACSGCRQVLSLDDLPDTQMPCAATSFGTGAIQACVEVPAMELVLDGQLDTDTSPSCIGTLRDGTAACVVAGTSVVVNALRATGTLPLVIVSSSTITVTSQLDVASRRGNSPVTGAGGNSPLCAAGSAATFTPTGGGGGSFGGTFGSAGGDGGAARLDGLPGLATPVGPRPTFLRGGCPGGVGGQNNPDLGPGGHGGGAVYLIASTEIVLMGPINASGSAGNGGAGGEGGNGGGSGGMIGLDAPNIRIADGVGVIANGGAGGEGGALQGGNPGGEPAAAMPMTPANGGNGNTPDGGDGGNGAAGTTEAADGMAATLALLGGGGVGGGGGGGGVGVIIVRGTVTGGMFSPAPAPE